MVGDGYIRKILVYSRERTGVVQCPQVTATLLLFKL